MKEMFLNNKKCVFVCLFFVCFSLYFFKKNHANKISLSSIINKIPKNDQLILEDFFQGLITQSLFGYVLFGDKPLTEAGCINPASDFYFVYRIDPENLKFHKGIE